MDISDWIALLNEPGYVVAPPWGTPMTGATEEELQALAAWFGRPLPQDYASFLQFMNGAEIGYRDMWSVRVWPSGDVPGASREYGYTSENIAGAIAFGSDTGDEVLLFDIRPEHPDGQYPIYALDYLEVREGWRAAIRAAESFRDLLLLKQSFL